VRIFQLSGAGETHVPKQRRSSRCGNRPIRAEHECERILRLPVTIEYLDAIAVDPLFAKAEIAFRRIADAYKARYINFRELNVDYDGEGFGDFCADRYKSLLWEIVRQSN
jgi:hypothetical protein